MPPMTQKYGIRNWQGGGRSSARETIGRVAAGAIAKKILKQIAGVEIIAYVKSIKDIEANNINQDTVTQEQVESNIVRCPDSVTAEKNDRPHRRNSQRKRLPRRYPRMCRQKRPQRTRRASI